MLKIYCPNWNKVTCNQFLIARLLGLAQLLNMGACHQPAAAQLRGTVKDRVTQKPVENADVRIYDRNYYFKSRCFTSIEGHFELEPVGNGTYKIVIIAKNYMTRSLDMAYRFKPKNLLLDTLTLEPFIIPSK